MANTFELIEEKIVGAGGASTLIFSNIPQTYKDLSIYISCASSTASSWINIRARFNGASTDTAEHRSFLNWNVPSSGTVAAGRYTHCYIGDFSGSTDNSSSAPFNWSSGGLYMFDYAGSNYKVGYAYSSAAMSVPNSYQENSALVYGSTSPITQIELYPSSGSYVENSKFSIYGIKNS